MHDVGAALAATRPHSMQLYTGGSWIDDLCSEAAVNHMFILKKMYGGVVYPNPSIRLRNVDQFGVSNPLVFNVCYTALMPMFDNVYR